MKRYSSIVAATNIDSHGERMSRRALDSIVDTVSRSYIPIGVEHDPRVPPQGRIASAFVQERTDGEFEASAIMELFESDSASEIISDDRELVLHRPKTNRIAVSYDWTHRHKDDQDDIESIASLLGSESVYDAKKAAEPISIITLVGTFVLGGIASGFVSQIGKDAWTAVRERLEAIFERKDKRKGEQLFVINAVLEVGDTGIEVQAILADPIPGQIETLVTEGLQMIDRVLPTYLAGAQDIRRYVFDIKDGNLELNFVVRKDCVPLKPTVSVDEILNHQENS